MEEIEKGMSMEEFLAGKLEEQAGGETPDEGEPDDDGGPGPDDDEDQGSDDDDVADEDSDDEDASEEGGDDEEEPAADARASRLVSQLRTKEKELVLLRKRVKELEDRGPTADHADVLEEYEVDRISAIRKLIGQKYGDQTDAEMMELANEFLYVLTGVDKNPDLDPKLAAERRFKQLESSIKLKQRELDRKIREQEEAQRKAAEQAHEARAQKNIEGWIGQRAKDYRFLAAQPEAANLVLRELRLQQQENGLVLESEEHTTEVLGEISRGYDTYFRKQAERYSELLRGLEDGGSDVTKRKTPGSKKKTLTNHRASVAASKKKKTESKEPKTLDDFLASKGL